MKSTKQYVIAIVLALGIVIGVGSLQAAWNTPPSSPPNDNVPAPINTGLNEQNKLGWLSLNTDVNTPYEIGLQVFGKALFEDGIQIPSGSPAEGKVLTAIDDDGNTEWQTPTGGGGEDSPLTVTFYGPFTSDSTHVLGTHDYCALTQVYSTNENHGGTLFRDGAVWKITNFGGSDQHSVACFDGNIGGSAAAQQCNTAATGPLISLAGSELNLLINGNNICKDTNGCSIQMTAYNVSDNRPVSMFSWRIPFVQNSNNAWLTSVSGGFLSGTNGDSTPSTITNSVGGVPMQIVDDQTAVETSPDKLYILDSSNTYYYKAAVCDF